MPPLKEEATVIPVAACPGYVDAAPGVGSLQDMEGRISYLLNPDVDPMPGAPVRPFGYPTPSQAPLKRSDLSRYGTPAELFAISDVDKGNVTDPSVGWWSDLPYKPVHGSTRNQIFFDAHVAAVKTAGDVRGINWFPQVLAGAERVNRTSFPEDFNGYVDSTAHRRDRKFDS